MQEWDHQGKQRTRSHTPNATVSYRCQTGGKTGHVLHHPNIYSCPPRRHPGGSKAMAGERCTAVSIHCLSAMWCLQ